MRCTLKIKAFSMAAVIASAYISGNALCAEAYEYEDHILYQSVGFIDSNAEISFPEIQTADSENNEIIGEGYIYNMLNTDEERIFYNRLLAACREVDESYDYYDTTPYAEYDDLQIDYRLAQEIAWLFHYDHPEFYWIEPRIWLNYTGIAFSIYEDYKDGSNRSTVTKLIENSKAKYVSKALSYENKYDRAKFLFDELRKNVSYGSGEFDQSAVSAFLDERTVCSGYSKAYSILCSEVGVESVIITGYNHGWNAIKIYDKWYLADVTNGHFLYSDDEMHQHDVNTGNKYTMTLTSETGEKETITFYMHDTAALKYPVYHDSFPECSSSYIPLGDINTDGLINITDAAYILEIYSNNAAGCQTDISDDQKSAGDVNSDDSINIIDAELILKYYSCYAAGIDVSWSSILIGK